MDKQLLLIERMKDLRFALANAATTDPRVLRILERYTPLFDEIEAGNIVPPRTGLYRNPMFARDSVFENEYGPGSKLSTADSAFLSALEDWPSQSWYRQLSEHTVAQPSAHWSSSDASPSLWRLLWRLAPNSSMQMRVLRMQEAWTKRVWRKSTEG